MITTTLRTPCTDSRCPPADQLDRLVHGRLSGPDTAAVTDHLGECAGCQERLEELATAGDSVLSGAVRHIDTAGPPSESAYWRAAREVQDAVTGDFPKPKAAVTDSRVTDRTAPDLDAHSDVKLDFLQPSPTPGHLGMLGTFDIRRVLGHGGMGVVLHAYDPCLQRDVAIKILDPLLANNSVARQRFCREARAAAAVAHENLVAVHQVDEDEKSNLPFLVMQLVNGESLEQRLRRVSRMTVLEVVRLGAQAAAGLSSAHAGGLIHRDIKPGNILIEAGTDKVKLTDFGLARAAEDMKLTRTGFVAGTPLYMAP
ncbi:MAG: serine/threonine-protein kinase, partial [Fimbriiglobus sp.]